MEPNSKKRKLSQHSGKNDGSIEAENARMKQTIEKLNTTIVNQALEITELKSNQSNGDDDVDEDMEAEMEILKENGAKLRTELGEAEKKIEEEQKRYKAEIAALKSAAEARNKEVKELEEHLSTIKDVKVDMRATNDELEKERAAFKLKIDEMKEHVDKLTQKEVEWKAQSKEARRQIDGRDKEINKLKKQLTIVIDVKNDMERLKKEKKEIKAEITALNSQIDGLTKKNSVSKAEAEKAREEIKELKKQLASANTANNELSAKIAAADVQQKALGARITDLTEKNSDYEKRIEGMKDEQRKSQLTVAEYKKKIKELEDRLQQIHNATDLRYNNEPKKSENATIIDHHILDSMDQVRGGAENEQLTSSNIEPEENFPIILVDADSTSETAFNSSDAASLNDSKKYNLRKRSIINNRYQESDDDEGNSVEKTPRRNSTVLRSFVESSSNLANVPSTSEPVFDSADRSSDSVPLECNDDQHNITTRVSLRKFPTHEPTSLKNSPDDTVFDIVECLPFDVKNSNGEIIQIDKKLLVFTSKKRTHCYEYFTHGRKSKYRCITCFSEKKDVFFKATIDDVGNKTFNFNNLKHICQPINYLTSNYQSSLIFKSPNFEFTHHPWNGEMKPLLIIFDRDNRNFCYKFGYHTFNKYFRCYQCREADGTNVTARFIHHDGSNAIELGQLHHACEPKRYVPVP